jgi:hypothetical protein
VKSLGRGFASELAEFVPWNTPLVNEWPSLPSPIFSSKREFLGKARIAFNQARIAPSQTLRRLRSRTCMHFDLDVDESVDHARDTGKERCPCGLREELLRKEKRKRLNDCRDLLGGRK